MIKKMFITILKISLVYLSTQLTVIADDTLRTATDNRCSVNDSSAFCSQRNQEENQGLAAINSRLECESGDISVACSEEQSAKYSAIQTSPVTITSDYK